MFCLSALVFVACSGGKQTVDIEDLAKMDSIDSAQDTLHLFDEEVKVPATVDELFDDFFYTFISDERFQVGRVNFPLICTEGKIDVTILKDDWKETSKFGQQDFYTVILDRLSDIEFEKDTAVSRVAVQWVYLKEKYVESNRFYRHEGKWRLQSIDRKFFDEVVDGEFLDFYARFATDSAFQVSAIEYPLKMEYSDDGGDIPEEDTNLTLERWNEMKSELPIPEDCIMVIDYGQPHSSQKGKILQMEGTSNGLVMQFKFAKQDDEWKLVEIEC